MTKFGYILLAIVALVGGFAGYLIHGNLGGTSLTYTAALSQIERYNFDKGLITDLQNVRAPLAGVISATVTGLQGTVTPALPTSTVVTTAGAAVGDLVLVDLSSTTLSTSPYLLAHGFVSGAGTTTVILASATSSISIGGATITVRVLPAVSFAAPSALGSATTSTP